jgi:hypothetical protein
LVPNPQRSSHVCSWLTPSPSDAYDDAPDSVASREPGHPAHEARAKMNKPAPGGARLV